MNLFPKSLETAGTEIAELARQLQRTSATVNETIAESIEPRVVRILDNAEQATIKINRILDAIMGAGK